MKKYWSQLAAYQKQADILAPEVSDKPIGWHLDHSLRVIIGIVNSLRNADPAQYSPGLSLSARYVFLTGHIPRGKGRAPKAVVAPSDIDASQLQELLQKAQALYPLLDELPPQHYFEHPYFGHLKVKRSRRFLEIHTYHHLKIIRDILKEATS